MGHSGVPESLGFVMKLAVMVDIVDLHCLTKAPRESWKSLHGHRAIYDMMEWPSKSDVFHSNLVCYQGSASSLPTMTVICLESADFQPSRPCAPNGF